MPEGSVISAEIGVRELINILTVEGLTTPDVDGRALPGLAQAWTWEADGLRLRVQLRNGVRFHDGTALTSAFAADLIREAIDRPGNRSSFPSLKEITSVRPDSEHEIVFDLSAKSALLPEDLQFPLTKRNGSEQVGTGAYRIASRDEAGKVVLEAFDDYHMGSPHISRLVLTPFDTIRTAWASLLRGDVDMVTDVPAEAVEFVQNDNVEVFSFARRYQFLLAFNSRRPPLTLPSVRRALNLAVDREDLIKSVLQGHGVPAAGPIWPKHWAYDATISHSGFDRTFATTLLDGAGLPPGAAGAKSEIPGARMRLMCLLPSEFSVLERVALHLQKQLYEIGVDMQFQVVPIEEYDRRIRTGEFDSVLIDLISGPTLTRPYIFWSSPKRFQGINAFGYENAETERLFDQLRASTNEASVRSAVSRLQRVFLNDPPALFLAWNERTRAFRRDFRAVLEKDRDPLYTIWQWTENTDRASVSTQ